MRRKTFWLFSAALLAVLVAFYFPFLAGQKNYYQSDISYYFEPFMAYISSAFREHRLPLWNPYLYCGMSQVAVPSPGMFYPFSLLFLLPFSQALSLYLVSHQWIAGVGACLLAAALGLGELGAVVAGIGFALAGYMFALQDNFTLVATIAWFPLLLLCLRKIESSYTGSNVLWMMGASACMALMVAAGRPELFVPAGVIAVAFSACTAYGAWQSGSSGAVWQFAFMIGSMAAGAVLAMPVVLPALEWAKVSPRSNGLDLKWVLLWSANWYDCLCMIFAQPLGDLTVLGSKYLNMVAAKENAIPYLQSTYVGPGIFTFALWSLFDKRWRFNLCVLAVLAGSLLMAIGKNTPIVPYVLSWSSLLAGFRYPVKLMIFPMSCLVLLAARGAGRAASGEVGKPAVWIAAIVWTLALLLGAAFVAIPQLAEAYCSYRHFTGTAVSAMKSAQNIIGVNLLSTACVGMAFVGAYFVYRHWRLKQWIFELAVCIGLAAVLVWPAVQYLRHGTRADFFTCPIDSVSAARQELDVGLQDHGQHVVNRALTLFFDPLTPSQEFLDSHHYQFQDGFYSYSRSLLLPNNNVEYAVPYAFGYEAAEVGTFKTWFSQALGKSTQNRGGLHAESDLPMARFCALTGVKLVMTQIYQHRRSNVLREMDSNYFNLRSSDWSMNMRRYEPLVHLPRAYFAERIGRCSVKQFLASMLDKNGPLLYPTVVDDQFPQSLLPSDKTIDGVASSAVRSISFATDNPESISITTDCSQSGLFVLSDQFYPGWIAFVDGKMAPIYRVNYFARGLWLPAGRHRIQYQYSPMSLMYGACASAFVLFMYLALLFFAKSGPATGEGKSRPADEPSAIKEQVL
jgi:hypothetical protein